MSINSRPLILIFFAALLTLASCRSHKEAAVSSVPEKVKTNRTTEKYAGIIGVPPKDITNASLYDFIDEWYGVPYKYGGKDKHGIDCSNFAATLLREVYNQSLSGSSSGIYKLCTPIDKSSLKEGDLIFFKIEQKEISHIGVYLQNNKFVHATTKKGVMIDDLDEPYYKKYYYKAGRYKK